MTPMEGALYLNARNVYYVPMFRKVDMTRLNRAMDTLNNVGWSMEYVYSNPEVMENLLAQANQFPNVTRGVLDDFFNEENEVNNVTNYSPEFLASMRERMHTGASHPLEMWMVFYTKQFEKDVAPYINEFDGISLWFWNESETRQFDDRCERFFELTPNKKRAIGIYLYSTPFTLSAVKIYISQIVATKESPCSYRLHISGHGYRSKTAAIVKGISPQRYNT